MMLGAHVSTQGGVSLSPQNGVDLGCDAIQIFSKNQRQWGAKPLQEAEIAAFRENYVKSRLQGVLVHGSYLINVASPDPAMWTKSRDALLDEAQRCDQLGIPLLNMHPGAHMGTGAAAGCARIADAIRYVLDNTDKVTLLLESMAGQGTTIGARVEDLARIRELGGNDARVGYCLDTCHLFAAGFDLATPTGYKDAIRVVGDHLGLAHVKAFHLNDSEKPLGSHVDRHANIGQGLIGEKGFAPLMQDRRFERLPMVLETPLAEEGYRKDLEILRRLAA